MSTTADRTRILSLLTAEDWTNRYVLTDHPDLAHLNRQQLTQDLAWLRKAGHIEQRQSPTVRSRLAGGYYPTHDYRLRGDR